MSSVDRTSNDDFSWYDGEVDEAAVREIVRIKRERRAEKAIKDGRQDIAHEIRFGAPIHD